MYIMDVSGSMGEEQKEIVRIESFWIDTWLRSQYKGVECRYLIHDVVAREVDRDTFFHVRESGGTAISSAYKLAAEVGSKLSLDRVLLVSDGKKIAVGQPYLEGKTIECEVVRHGRDKKIIVFKKKRRKKYRRTRGHRQDFTEILIKALPK